MIRFFLYSVIVGTLVFLAFFFLAPAIVADPGVAPRVAGLLLDWSNARFASTPPLLAAYIANLNLTMVSLSAALLAVLAVLSISIVGRVLSAVTGSIATLLRSLRKEVPPADLPPIEMDPCIRESVIGKGVVGRGLDSIDRN
jgi:hypothetical protein